MAGNSIVLGVRGVSRRHARLTLDADALTLEDLGSKNGTMANGVRIQRTRLVPGDEVRIGPVLLRLEAVDAGDTDLAIVLSRGETSPPGGLPAKDTTAVSTEEGIGLGRWRASARLAVRPVLDLTGGLSKAARARRKARLFRARPLRTVSSPGGEGLSCRSIVA